jgi:hypothetical protein
MPGNDEPVQRLSASDSLLSAPCENVASEGVPDDAPRSCTLGVAIDMLSSWYDDAEAGAT